MGLRAIFCLSIAAGLAFAGPARAAEAVAVIEVKGDVSVQSGPQKAFVRVRPGQRIGHGARLRTGEDGKVVLQFADGSRTRLMPKSEAIVRAPGEKIRRPNGVVLFFGRVWTRVVKSVSGEETFEVRGANAVAGVRGTVFEVGVADDGSSRVVVSEGKVDVSGDAGRDEVRVGGGWLVDADNRGRLQERRKAPKSLDWGGWFARRARALEARGVAIAKDLYGRLDRRKAQVERLLNRQRRLRRQIEALEAQRGRGDSSDAELQEKLRELRRVTARLEDMKRRLQAACGIFGMWGRKVASSDDPDARRIGLLAEDVKRVERGFADLFEEGTDLSEEGMDEMMEDMKKGPTLKPKKSAKDELF